MNSPHFLRAVGATALLPLLVVSVAAADNATKAPAPSTRPAASSKGGTSGRILPDPALLDGAAHAPDKKSEHGMIGDFELPGDENAKGDKVGGSSNQNPPPPGGGGGQQSNMPMGLPSGGGASGQQQGQQGQQQGGAQGGAQSAQAGGQQAGGQQGGPQNPNAGGAPVAGGGDPSAQPQGIQVSELGGEASGQQGGAAGAASGAGEKPKAVAIGDKAMRIDNSSAAQAGVVGAQQQAGATQQHEKGTGSGGKGAGGTGGPNRVEKGRAIPSGL